MAPRDVNVTNYAGPDRREHARNGSNGRDWTSLRAWAQAIGVVGIPGAIALWLVYMGSTEIPKLIKGQAEIITEIRLQRQETAELKIQTNALIRVARIACANAAKDDNARSNCYN